MRESTIAKIFKKKHGLTTIIRFFVKVFLFFFLFVISIHLLVKVSNRKLKREINQTAQEINRKREEHFNLLQQRIHKHESAFQEHQQKVHNSIDKIREHMAGSYERFIEFGKETDKQFKAIVEQQRKEWDANMANVLKKMEERQKLQEQKWREMRRQQLIDMGLYSEKILEKISPKKSETIQEKVKDLENNKSPRKNSTDLLNPPFNRDKTEEQKDEECSTYEHGDQLA
ncbi:MAG TPA: hypothetical protein VHA52_06510 [Candidatus Babeliaceae bacterium]|nr:hypothetical protein [Candidatus Babeliaceae bacterium]